MSCSRTQHGGSRSRTPDLSLRSPTLYHLATALPYSVQEIRPFSLFQNLVLGKTSTDDKCHFAIVSLFTEFEPRQKLNQSQMSPDNLMGYILSISMCMQNFITIFHSVQEIVPASLFSEFGARQSLDQ